MTCTLAKHFFYTEGLARGEDPSQAPGNRAGNAWRQPRGRVPNPCPDLHLPVCNTLPFPQQYPKASALNKTLKHKSEILTYLLKKEEKKKKKKPVIYVNLVGFQCCPAVTVEPVTEIIQQCSFTPVKGINTPLALQKSLAVLTCFIIIFLHTS